MANQCSEPGCAGKVWARGLCRADYQRAYRKRALPRWWDRPPTSPVKDHEYLAASVPPSGEWVRADW
jgi:hypothetical protein